GSGREGGMGEAGGFMGGELGPLVEDARRAGVTGQDFKSTLQELLQARDLPLPEYRLLSTFGPDHHKQFEIEVVVRGESLAIATGSSKKDAEQEAARSALERLRA